MDSRRDSRRTIVRLGACLVVLVTLSGCTACNDRVTERPCACAEAPPPVDAALVAFLSKARAAHHQADQREQAKDLPGAIVALEKVTSTTFGASTPRPEAKEVMADTRARLADLRGQLGKHDEAEREIEQGLRLAPTDSYFEGHLYEMRGVNEERRAKMLTEASDEPAAESARKKAFASFEKAIEIQDRVIRKELVDAGGAPP